MRSLIVFLAASNGIKNVREPFKKLKSHWVCITIYAELERNKDNDKDENKERKKKIILWSRVSKIRVLSLISHSVDRL